MKSRIRWRRLMVFAIVVCMMVMNLSVAAFAATPWNSGEPVSLTLDLRRQTRRSSFSLYLVGVWDGNCYVVGEAFAGSGISLKLDNAEAVILASKALKDYAQSNHIDPVATGNTQNGRVTFSDISQGMYLVTQSNWSRNNVTVAPFLVMLPDWEEDRTEWVYDVLAYPKSEDVTEATTGGGGGGGDNPPETTPAETTVPEDSTGETPPDETEPPSDVPVDPDTPIRVVDPDDPDNPIYEGPYDPDIWNRLPPGSYELITIDDEGVPLARFPLTIEDNPIPLAKTGDASIPSALLCGVMVVSLAGMAALWRRKKDMK